MLFNSLEFNAMQSGLDALWLKQQVITNNLANADVPGFKAQVVSFQNVLNDELRDQTTGRSYEFEAKVITDQFTEARPDGNNVDVEKDSLELWRAYAQYSYLTQKISGQFKNMRYVINNAMR